jgi:hypothetical protein
MIKSIKKNIKKQSTSKTKWGCPNPWAGSCGQDNQIEDKTEKKKQSLLLKRIEFWRTK